MRRGLAFAVLIAATLPAAAQDMPGIENCSAEKTMERRTGCLQSNVNYLKAQLTKVSLESGQKLDAAARQIDALKTGIAGLQGTVAQLQARVEMLEKKAAEKEPAKK
jgi:esterase/lipase